MTKTTEAAREKHRLYMRKWSKYHTEYMRLYRARMTPEKREEANRRRRESPYSKNYSLMRRYGITLEEREELLAKQGGVCAICGASEPGWKHNWVIDHCHSSKKIRGVLCHSCNIVLGRVKDCPKVLTAMIEYLARTNGAVI